MTGATLTLRNAGGSKTVTLSDYLDAAAEERAHEAAHDWIKQLRRLEVQGLPFRDRFTARGDSLWWFTELYLHKERVILDTHRAIAAVTALLDAERPADMTVESTSPIAGHVAAALAPGHAVRCPSPGWRGRMARLDLRARGLALSGVLTPERWRRADPSPAPAVAAFVHRAFWRAGIEDGSAESYIGSILAELERRLDPGAVRYVGIGPSTSFAARRKGRSPGAAPAAITPIERFASRAALAESRAVWRRRHQDFGVLTAAPALREAARIGGVDCWPIVREQLAGVAWLQWPWSVRAMDEAAAALDALEPRAVVTYAEAGGWGRALVLESRRRRIPSVGLQHGFIYRHWLNYRHEPDEIAATATPPFPWPTRTLLFDEYAARHLRERGRLPPESLRVTGSPGLDELARQIAALPPAEVAATRAALEVPASDALLLVATKEKEARESLGALLDAAGAVAGTIVVIKPHPAESADVYARHAEGHRHVRIAPVEMPLARLLAAARAVATVNSTVAIDGGALGIPALSFGLPNNLSPFVEAGAMAGSPDPADLTALLRRILYDEGFRQQVAGARRRVFGEPVAARGHGAAASSAAAILELVSD